MLRSRAPKTRPIATLASNSVSLSLLLLLSFLISHAQTLQLPASSVSPTVISDLSSDGRKPVKILVHPKNVTAFERKTAILVCEAEGDPKPTFSWFKDGDPLNKKRIPVIKYSRGTVLRIERLKNDRDGGEYACQVENGVGSGIRSQALVRAINESDAPAGFPRFISQPVATQTVEAGGVATINCQASGDPQPEYSWFHESIPIDLPDPDRRIIVEDNGTLRVSNVSESDKGEYLCTASNHKGVVTSPASNLMVSLEPLPDGAPTDLKYKLTSPTDVTISWSTPETKNNVTITGYQLYFGKLGASSSTKLDIPNNNRYAFSNLTENTEYAFRIRAKSKGGFGSYSETITFTTPKDSPPPPANVKAMADSYNSAMVWWDDAAYFSGITGFRVYYSMYNLTNSLANEDLDRWMTKNVTLTNSVIITNLVDHSTYEVRVCAISTNFIGKLSNSVRFRTIPEEVPYDLKATDITTHSVKISWKPPLEFVPSKYKITYDAPEKSFLDEKGNKQTKILPLRTLTTTDVQMAITDLRPYTKYRINVTAIPSKEVFRPPVTVTVTTAMAAPKSLNEPTLIGAINAREFELFLPLASEEFGPVGHYYVCVLPADMPTLETDSYSTSELINAASSANPHGPYIAAKFPKSRMVKKFVLGDGKRYDGFDNRPLNRDQQYHVFVRAVVEHSDSLYADSAKSEPINILQPVKHVAQPSSTNESFKKVRWILASALGLSMILALILFVFWKKQRQISKTNQINETTIRLLPDHMMDRIYSSVPAEPIDRRNMNYQTRGMLDHRPVPVDQLAEHIDILKMNNNLKDEYESIEPGQQFTWEHSYMDYNRPKNRYGNVVAYDHSRVILNPIDGIPGSDYINANYCDGYNKQGQYIATQGPLPDTVGDFWRMIWEQNSRTIVMMTQIEERGRNKCCQYWPTSDSATYHGIIISPIGVEELAYYSIRTFRLQHNNEVREVCQFQFTAWPDHGVPDHPTPFLMFLRRIKATNPPDAGPMIVLCSAGVGRTGCFIVIDSMIERIKNEKTIDIYGHVTNLRAQRNYIVQTEDQYMFIHDAVLEAIIAADTEVPDSKLSEHLKRLMQVQPIEGATGLELEFKRLASIRYGGQKFVSANLPINKHKNRLMNILPYESTRVCLEPIAGVEGSDYINASFCDGYRQRNAYIATQSPLPDTVEDMWRMLIEHNSGIIVMLTKLKEMGREKCTQYWPAERFGDYGPYRIVLNQEYNTTVNYILREFTITDSRQPGYNRVVRQFHYLNWPEQGVPKSGDDFIRFIAEVHKTKQTFGYDGPITVHCSVGVGRTGVFIALSIVLERLRNEGYLDLFETVRTLRTQRPGMVQTEDQYQFCYQTALEYIRNFDHYTH